MILFIHGFATGPDIWNLQLREFSKDFKVITDPEMIDGKEDAVIVGWSMGGWKAIELYQEFPKKIKGLVLVSAFAKYLKSDDYPYGTPPALLRKLEKRFKADFKGGLRYFYDLLFQPNNCWEDKRWHYLIDRLPVPEKEDIDRWFEKLRNEDKRPMLPNISVPVLIIAGEQDQIVPPASSKYLHEKILNSRLPNNCWVHILEGVGHAPMVEVPQLFNALLRRFVESHAG